MTFIANEYEISQLFRLPSLIQKSKNSGLLRTSGKKVKIIENKTSKELMKLEGLVSQRGSMAHFSKPPPTREKKNTYTIKKIFKRVSAFFRLNFYRPEKIAQKFLQMQQVNPEGRRGSFYKLFRTKIMSVHKPSTQKARYILLQIDPTSLLRGKSKEYLEIKSDTDCEKRVERQVEFSFEISRLIRKYKIASNPHFYKYTGLITRVLHEEAVVKACENKNTRQLFTTAVDNLTKKMDEDK